MTDFGPVLADPFVRLLIRYKAKRLTQTYPDPATDRHDVEHDLMIELLRAFARYDPARGSHRGFATVVLRRAEARHHRARNARKRAVVPYSLNAPCFDDGKWEPVDPHAEAERARTETMLDAETVKATLNQEYQDLVDRLGKDSVAAVARDLGVSRSTLVATLRKLRKEFRPENSGETG
jgi:hypothetical protein